MNKILQEDDALPGILLTEIFFDQQQLQLLKNKNLVVYFYPKDDTPGCTVEAKDFSCNLDRFADLDTYIIGISRDNKKSHQNFIDKYNLKIALLSDEDEELCNAFGCLVEKSMFGKKYFGIERSTFLFDKSGILKKAWKKVSVKNHVNEVFEFIQKL